MLVCDYIVEQIDGDYAHLKRVDQPEEELKVVARALLPAEIYEGCELHYELMQYSMNDKAAGYRGYGRCQSYNRIQCDQWKYKTGFTEHH